MSMTPVIARDESVLAYFAADPSRIERVQPSGTRQFRDSFRTAIFAAHRGRCAYCGESVQGRNMHIDHVTPRSKGGETVVENLVAACQSCNSAKRERDLDDLRLFIAVRRSPLAGVILPAQVRQLKELGYDLGISPAKFAFEVAR